MNHWYKQYLLDCYPPCPECVLVDFCHAVLVVVSEVTGINVVCTVQVPYLPSSGMQTQNVLRLLRGRAGCLADLGSGDGRLVSAEGRGKLELILVKACNIFTCSISAAWPLHPALITRLCYVFAPANPICVPRVSVTSTLSLLTSFTILLASPDFLFLLNCNNYIALFCM